MREIGVKAFCDGRRGTRWTLRGQGEVCPIQKGNRHPLQSPPKQVSWDCVFRRSGVAFCLCSSRGVGDVGGRYTEEIHGGETSLPHNPT